MCYKVAKKVQKTVLYFPILSLSLIYHNISFYPRCENTSKEQNWKWFYRSIKWLMRSHRIKYTIVSSQKLGRKMLFKTSLKSILYIINLYPWISQNSCVQNYFQGGKCAFYWRVQYIWKLLQIKIGIIYAKKFSLTLGNF